MDYCEAPLSMQIFQNSINKNVRLRKPDIVCIDTLTTSIYNLRNRLACATTRKFYI